MLICYREYITLLLLHMLTYSAALAPWRMKPLHPKYIERAQEHATRMIRNGGAVRGVYECMCPYCGSDSGLHATVRVGAKQQVYEVPVTSTGYHVPAARDRTVDLLVLYCNNIECGGVIEPMSYLSPVAFHYTKTNISLLPDEM